MSDKEKMFYSLLLQAFESSDLEIIKCDGKNRGTKYYLVEKEYL